jgi:hypothetical protein
MSDTCRVCGHFLRTDEISRWEQKHTCTTCQQAHAAILPHINFSAMVQVNEWLTRGFHPTRLKVMKRFIEDTAKMLNIQHMTYNKTGYKMRVPNDANPRYVLQIALDNPRATFRLTTGSECGVKQMWLYFNL